MQKLVIASLAVWAANEDDTAHIHIGASVDKELCLAIGDVLEMDDKEEYYRKMNKAVSDCVDALHEAVNGLPGNIREKVVADTLRNRPEGDIKA